MRCSTDEALQEIMRRSRHIERRREKRSIRLYSFVSLFAIGALVLLISGMAEGVMPISGQEVMGSFLLPAKAGAYVLTAVIAFTFGVILTIKTQKIRNAKQRQVDKYERS